jgi:hypothetical protein
MKVTRFEKEVGIISDSPTILIDIQFEANNISGDIQVDWDEFTGWVRMNQDVTRHWDGLQLDFGLMFEDVCLDDVLKESFVKDILRDIT